MAMTGSSSSVFSSRNSCCFSCEKSLRCCCNDVWNTFGVTPRLLLLDPGKEKRDPDEWPVLSSFFSGRRRHVVSFLFLPTFSTRSRRLEKSSVELFWQFFFQFGRESFTHNGTQWTANSIGVLYRQFPFILVAAATGPPNWISIFFSDNHRKRKRSQVKPRRYDRSLWLLSPELFRPSCYIVVLILWRQLFNCKVSSPFHDERKRRRQPPFWLYLVVPFCYLATTSTMLMWDEAGNT